MYASTAEDEGMEDELECEKETVLDLEPPSPIVYDLTYSFVEISLPVEANNDQIEIQDILRDLEAEPRPTATPTTRVSQQLPVVQVAGGPKCHIIGCQMQVGLEKCAWSNANCLRCKRQGGCGQWYCIDHVYSGTGKRSSCSDCRENVLRDANIDILCMMLVPAMLILLAILGLIVHFMTVEVVYAESACG